MSDVEVELRALNCSRRDLGLRRPCPPEATVSETLSRISCQRLEFGPSFRGSK